MLDHKISVIANPEGQAWDFALGVLDQIKEKVAEDESLDYAEENIELNPLEVRYFKDGEFLTKIPENVRMRDTVFIHDSNLDPCVWSKQLSMVNKTLRHSSPHYSITVGNYWKWARQDRKGESRVPITAKDDGENIQRDHLGVITVEVHNEAMQGFFDFTFDNLPFFPKLVKHLKETDPKILKDLVFVGPDSGSVKRNRKYTKSLEMDVACVDKDRTMRGELGKTLGILGVEYVKGKDALLFDDLIATGTSIVNGAIALRNAGARRVFGAVPHGLFVEGIEKVVENFDIFFLGNSMKYPLVPGEGVLLLEYAAKALPQETKNKLPDKKYLFFSDILKLQPPYKDSKLPSNVREIPLQSLIGESVYRICTGKSVSQLYDLSPNNSTSN